MDHIAIRRQAAQVRRVADEYLSKRLSLEDPLFNIREIIKQMILVEDHLTHPYKLCPDCVHKHFLAIEAFAEEGITLDEGEGIFVSTLEGLAEVARKSMENFHDGVSPPKIAQGLRLVRKFIMPMASDPRSIRDRLASVHIARQKLLPR